MGEYAARSYNIPAITAHPKNAKKPSSTAYASITIKTISPVVLELKITGNILV